RVQGSVAGGRMCLAWDGKTPYALVNLRKVQREGCLTSGSRKNRDGGLSQRIEIRIVERGYNLRLESWTLRPGGTAIRLTIESHGHGFDHLPALIHNHITVYCKVRGVAEDHRADQHRLALQHLCHVGLTGLQPP